MRSTTNIYSTLPAVCIDLDGTLLRYKSNHESYLVPIAIDWLMAAQASALPCYIVTARSIGNLFLELLNHNKVDEIEEIDEDTLEIIKTTLFFNSFKFVLSKFKQLKENGNPIEIPIICTLYDPFLEDNQQGLYYQAYEKMNDYLIEKIDELLSDDLTNPSEKYIKFFILIKTMKKILSPGDLPLLGKNHIKIPNDIIQILQTEKKLSSYNIINKNHQFYWVGLHSAREHIIHADDYSVIYNGLNVKLLTDVNVFFPYKITSKDSLRESKQDFSFSVYCIPFDVKAYSPKTLLQTMINTLNFPILKMIYEFEDLLLERYCCFFRTIKSEEERSVNWIINLLHECCITYNQVTHLTTSSHLEEKININNQLIFTSNNKPNDEQKESTKINNFLGIEMVNTQKTQYNADDINHSLIAITPTETSKKLQEFPKSQKNNVSDFKPSSQYLHLSSSILINKVNRLPIKELKKFVRIEKLDVIQKLQLLEDTLTRINNPKIKNPATISLLGTVQK